MYFASASAATVQRRRDGPCAGKERRKPSTLRALVRSTVVRLATAPGRSGSTLRCTEKLRRAWLNPSNIQHARRGPHTVQSAPHPLTSLPESRPVSCRSFSAAAVAHDIIPSPPIHGAGFAGLRRDLTNSRLHNRQLDGRCETRARQTGGLESPHHLSLRTRAIACWPCVEAADTLANSTVGEPIRAPHPQ